MATISIKEAADSIPELFEGLRPDLLDDSIISKMMLAATQFAEVSGVIKREYEIELRDCVDYYKLEVCGDEKIMYIEDVCWHPNECEKDCSVEQFRLIAPKRCLVQTGRVACGQWCKIECYGGRNIRVVPPDVVEITPANGLSGRLILTASVAPTHNACSIDEEFITEHKLPLMYGTMAFMLEAPGEKMDQNLALKYRSMFKNELERHYTRKLLSKVRGTVVMGSARRFV